MTKIGRSVAVLGNCTHVSLVETVKLNQLFERAESFEVYTIPHDQRSETAASLAEFECILTLTHGKNFGALATENLKSAYPGKVISVPTPFFSGAQPDMAYIKRGGAIDRAQNILGDYHSALILKDCANGKSREEVISRYATGIAFDEIDVHAIWNDALNELEQRELSADIKLSEFIHDYGLEEQLFITFNHPREMVIRYIVEQFVELVNGTKKQLKSLNPEYHNLYQNVWWPTHPTVAKALGARNHDKFPAFKQANTDGNARFGWEEFAALSYDYFHSNGDPSEFSIVTPAYLNARI
jgi:Polysaccharide biosynthesis enzyme WcbI